MEYDYSISSSTANNKVDPTSLIAEINAAIPSKKVLGVRVTDDDLRLYFNQSLSTSEENSLTLTLSNHNGVEVYPKILDLVRPEIEGIHFHDIDYKTQLNVPEKLRPVYFWDKGSLIKVEWYSDESRTNKVLIVDFAYEFESATNNYVRRAVTRSWVNTDESVNPVVKVGVKDYFTNPSEQLKASRRRRTNVLDNVGILVIKVLMALPDGANPPLSQSDAEIQGSLLLSKYETELGVFQRSSNNVPIHAAMESDTEFSWLDIDVSPLAAHPLFPEVATFIASTPENNLLRTLINFEVA